MQDIWTLGRQYTWLGIVHSDPGIKTKWRTLTLEAKGASQVT